MDYYFSNGELCHYGILGQKWGIRRFQNEDGSLTPEGKNRYSTEKGGKNILRSIANSSVGQRLVISRNKGYRADKKEIKTLSKLRKEQINRSDELSKKERKTQLRNLKSDTKKTLGEARVSAANAIYKWQSKAANERIQTTSLGKQYIKSMLYGGYGALTYDRLRSSGTKRLKAAAMSYVAGWADVATGGIISIGDYAINRRIKKD